MPQPQEDHHQMDSTTTVAQTIMPQPQEDHHHQMDSTTTVGLQPTTAATQTTIGRETTTDLNRTTTNLNRTTDPPPITTTRRTNSPLRPHGDGNEQLRIASLNVCGIYSKLQLGVFNDYIKQYDIFCISESKVSNGPHINNYTVFNLEKRSSNYRLPGIHGLQVYIANPLAGLCSQVIDINPRCGTVLWINVADHFILGALYIPCESSDYYKKDPEIFDHLGDDLSTIKSKFDLPIMLIGDFNSSTGTQNELMSPGENENERSYSNYPDIIDILKCLDIPVKRSNRDTKVTNHGYKLIDLCNGHELCIVNGRIGSDKHVGNTTCNDQSTIDYVICTPDLLPKVKNFTVDIFDPLFSDKHNPIHVHLNLDKSLTANCPADTTDNRTDTTKTCYVKCKWDNSKKEEYQKNFDKSKIHNIWTNLLTINANNVTQTTMENISQDLKDIFIDPAKTTGMYKEISKNTTNNNAPNNTPRTNNPWFNSICENSKESYKNAKKSMPTKLSEDNKAALKTLAKEHKNLIRKEKRKYYKELNKKIISLKSTNPGEYWKIINQGKRNTKVGKIPLNTLLNHFQELNKDVSTTNVNLPEDQTLSTNEIINTEFTTIEITKHINALKNNKSPGTDKILNEFMKYCPNELIPVIVKLFNVVLDSGVIPSEWTIGVIKPLYKNKGDINDVNNYRGITLLSCIGKLFTSVLNSRLYTYLTNENILGNEQAGFRPKHSTLDHIFALHILSSSYIDKNKQLYCAFVDYSKAFDFIDRTYMWQKLLDSNINGKVFNIIKNMYKNAKSQVSFKNTLSETFPCQVGVRQGENLSPLLFAIYLNDFNVFLSKKYNGLTKTTESISNELQIYLKIFCLLYADDTVVLAESAIELQKALDCLYTYCNKWALKVNIDKTKVIIFSKGKKQIKTPFKFGDTNIDLVDDYVYLGTTFNYNGKFNKAKAKQTLQASKATYSLLTRIRQLDLNFEVSIELFERLIIPILLYGSEIWGYENEKQIQTMYNKALRKFLRLHKSTSICMMYGELGLKEISEHIENRMINFWFNIATGEDSKISSILYKWIKVLYDQNIYKSSWIDKVKKTLDKIQMTNIFDDTSNVNKMCFKNNSRLRLKDLCAQKWTDEVNTNSTCHNYRAMTVVKKTQEYLLKLPKYYATVLYKFKCSNHYLPIVKGRHLKIPLDDRKCTLCNLNEIGDEFHYMFKCSFFTDQRNKYLMRYYIDMMNLAKFVDIIVRQFRPN